MATERIEALLERTDPSFLKSCNTTELQETGEGEIMAPYLMDCRRKQKHIFRQLCVVDDMIKLLASLESVDQLLNEPCPQNPGNEARSAWKALKAEYQDRVQEVEGLISSLQVRMEELQGKRKKLENLLSSLQIKKEECKEKERIAAKQNQRAEKQISFQLEDSLQAAQNTLNVCDLRLSKLKDEVNKQRARISDWTLLREGLETMVTVTQKSMQYRLLSVSPSELCLELLPRAAEKSLEPLRVSITMTNDHFHLQVFQGTAGLVEEAVDGPLRQVSAALVEVMERYISQGEMLSEIQTLHSRFAIDWCPAERLLIFLKTATTVCHLRVEEGYPSHGRATLLSVRKDGNLLDITDLQPTVKHPVLTEWLEFLSTNPNV
ncbi:ZW10 interactor isoform X1 [Myxocyprinus asiaticus]|uniref:ZW10 interactor isoform X1 n=2 Tax=Myxocyprinus asiaticus TaxID=70543 RepID=UPI002222D8C3|nr:ZW10 interactor isoform X1 [Myxocyprinus asiaticus]